MFFVGFSVSPYFMVDLRGFQFFTIARSGAKLKLFFELILGEFASIPLIDNICQVFVYIGPRFIGAVVFLLDFFEQLFVVI